MDDKVYELLEKVYIELQQTKKELKQDISKIEIKMENEVSNKIKSLYENQDIIIGRLDTIDNKLDDISQKVDKHDIKIQVIEGGKRRRSAK